MRAVKSKNTAPEIVIRKLIHSQGYRYRLHDQTLHGNPDIVFRKKKKVIFIHGCFWHGHPCKRGSRIPASNQPYWIQKIEKNKTRDLLHAKLLQEAGWSILVIWECELKNLDEIKKEIKTFLG
ncbi:MAG: DNA mismatch endonuclease Vsr [Acinetobacter oleivorans]|nr:DNA mismatch endonuclease Vsr [Acinetobacter oleivorans]